MQRFNDLGFATAKENLENKAGYFLHKLRSPRGFDTNARLESKIYLQIQSVVKISLSLTWYESIQRGPFLKHLFPRHSLPGKFDLLAKSFKIVIARNEDLFLLINHNVNIKLSSLEKLICFHSFLYSVVKF